MAEPLKRNAIDRPMPATAWIETPLGPVGDMHRALEERFVAVGGLADAYAHQIGPIDRLVVLASRIAGWAALSGVILAIVILLR